jgi:hypothetical protein
MAGEILNPFASDAFSMASLTEAMTRLPYNMYSRVGDMNLFTIKSVNTRTVIVEEQGGVLNLLPSTVRGGVPPVNAVGKRKVRSFVVPHIPFEDVVLPDEVSGIREFGSENALKTLMSKMAEKLQEMKNKHDLTQEWLRIGALKGVLYDGDGSTVLYNFFTEFGISPVTTVFNFSSSTFDAKTQVMNVLRQIEDNLHGEQMTGVHALASPEWFDAFTSHVSVKDAYKYFLNNNITLDKDLRKSFTFAGVTFEEYRGVASDLNGTSHKFIAASTVQFFPLGTNTTFRMYYAPADFNETVNTAGLPYYAKQEPRKFGRGTDLHTQSNPFAICLRPELLVQGTLS